LPIHDFGAIKREAGVGAAVPVWIVDGAIGEVASSVNALAVVVDVAAIAEAVKQNGLEKAARAVVAGRHCEERHHKVYDRGDAAHAGHPHLTVRAAGVHNEIILIIGRRDDWVSILRVAGNAANYTSDNVNGVEVDVVGLNVRAEVKDLLPIARPAAKLAE
jgi:hypothetical protein